MGSLYTHIVILDFMDFFMKLPPDSFSRGSLDSVGQLGGWLFPAFLKLQFDFQLSGFGVGDNICVQLLPGGDLPLGRIGLVSSFVGFLDFLLQLWIFAFLVCKFLRFQRRSAIFPQRAGDKRKDLPRWP